MITIYVKRIRSYMHGFLRYRNNNNNNNYRISNSIYFSLTLELFLIEN